MLYLVGKLFSQLQHIKTSALCVLPYREQAFNCSTGCHGWVEHGEQFHQHWFALKAISVRTSFDRSSLFLTRKMSAHYSTDIRSDTICTLTTNRLTLTYLSRTSVWPDACSRIVYLMSRTGARPEDSSLMLVRLN